MKYKKIISLFFVSIFIFCCFCVFKKNEKETYWTVMSDISNRIEPELKKKHGIYCVMTGGGNPLIHSRGYHAYKMTNIEKGRELILDVACKHIDESRKEEKLKSFMNEEVSYKNLNISVIFLDKNSNAVPGEIGIIWFSDGKITYDINDPDRKLRVGLYHSKTIHEETVEEAMELVYGNKPPL